MEAIAQSSNRNARKRNISTPSPPSQNSTTTSTNMIDTAVERAFRDESTVTQASQNREAPIPPSRTPISTSTTIAIQDPFGYGYEGRIAVTREFSARRARIAAVIKQLTTRSRPTPASVQYEYLMSHGYYTSEELANHPGFPLRKAEVQGTAEEVEKRNQAQQAANEKKTHAQAEHLEKMETVRWDERQDRIRRWEKKDTKNEDDERCNCLACRESRRVSISWQGSEAHDPGRRRLSYSSQESE